MVPWAGVTVSGETLTLSWQPFRMECVVRIPAPHDGYRLELMTAPELLRVPVGSLVFLDGGEPNVVLHQDGYPEIRRYDVGDEVVWRILYTLRILGADKGTYAVSCPAFRFSYRRPGTRQLEVLTTPQRFHWFRYESVLIDHPDAPLPEFDSWIELPLTPRYIVWLLKAIQAAVLLFSIVIFFLVVRAWRRARASDREPTSG